MSQTKKIIVAKTKFSILQQSEGLGWMTESLEFFVKHQSTKDLQFVL